MLYPKWYEGPKSVMFGYLDPSRVTGPGPGVQPSNPWLKPGQSPCSVHLKFHLEVPEDWGPQFRGVPITRSIACWDCLGGSLVRNYQISSGGPFDSACHP